MSTIIFQATWCRYFRPFCVSIRQNLLLDPRPVTSAKKKRKKKKGMTSCKSQSTNSRSVGSQSLGRRRSCLKAYFPVPSARSGWAELFCAGQIVNISGFAGHMVSATQFCTHRMHQQRSVATFQQNFICKTGERPSLALVSCLLTPRRDVWSGWPPARDSPSVSSVFVSL